MYFERFQSELKVPWALVKRDESKQSSIWWSSSHSPSVLRTNSTTLCFFSSLTSGQVHPHYQWLFAMCELEHVTVFGFSTMLTTCCAQKQGKSFQRQLPHLSFMYIRVNYYRTFTSYVCTFYDIMCPTFVLACNVWPQWWMQIKFRTAVLIRANYWLI